jgi:hypothetical protein
MHNLGLKTRNCFTKNTLVFQQTKYKSSKNTLEDLQMLNKNETKDKNI